MSRFNRGEWSEIYAILCMLICPQLSVGNADLEEMTNELYTLKSIRIGDNHAPEGIIEYILDPKTDVRIVHDSQFQDFLTLLELQENKNKIFEAIQNAPIGNGSFEIKGIDGLLAKLTGGEPIKSKALKKEDIDTTIFDNRVGKDVGLKYSIKSSLGSPATIFNASNHTNFLFSVQGLDDKYIPIVNGINTKTKLLDRVAFILKNGGRIKFEKVCDETLDYNLRLIDSNMPKYLANVLLQSYATGEKDLKELFLKSNLFEDERFALKKLEDLLEGISFGFFPSKKWDGLNQVNGGLVIVKNNGNVIILDLVYYKQEVLKYLIKETKLDSPSSSRYNMLHLYKLSSSDDIYFTLNLQIRYKK